MRVWLARCERVALAGLSRYLLHETLFAWVRQTFCCIRVRKRLTLTCLVKCYIVTANTAAAAIALAAAAATLTFRMSERRGFCVLQLASLSSIGLNIVGGSTKVCSAVTHT